MGVIDRLFGENEHVVRDTNVQVLLLAGITAPLGVSLISPLFETLTTPFGVSSTHIGLLVSAYTAPALVAVPLGGMLADRYGRKPVLIGGLLLFGFSGSAISLTTDFTTILALRVAQGVGFAGITPIVITALGDAYSGDAGATAQGLRVTALGGAQMTFPLLAGVLVGVAWQLPFLIYAMAIPIAVVVAVWFDDPTASEITDGRSGAVHRSSYVRELLELASKPRVATLLIAYVSPTFLYFGFHAYVSIIVLQVYDGTPRQAGLFVALFSGVFATTATQSGRITNWFNGRFFPLLGATAVMAAGLVALSFAPSISLALLGGIGFGVGFGLTFSLYRSILPEQAPQQLRGGIVSAGEGLARFAATISPIVIGVIIGLLEPAVGSVDAIRWAISAVGTGTALLSALAVILAFRWGDAGGL